MSIQELLFLLVIFIANIFEAMTGFAGTLLALPPSILLIGIYDAKAVLNIFALITCSIVAILNYKYINKKELLKILLFMLTGMGIGILLYEKLSVDYLLNIYAIFITIIALKNLLGKKVIKKAPIFIYVSILILAGILHGMFLSGGSLLVIYAIMALNNKNEFRATLAAVWGVLDLLLLINQSFLGYVNSSTLILSVYGFIPLILAIKLGNYLHQYIKQKAFYTITYILLLISGVSLLLS
ncbi:MAG TPA: sulfite exporter TauE/SafE family protein [Pseudogracilibacillus sp.]|nr:sulfite exporter TauE/SafE family protein [Pseudogracilibacillus sp.]